MLFSKLSRKRTLAAVLVALFCLSMVSGVIKIPFLSIPDAHAQITPTTIATSTSGNPVGLSNGVFSAHSVTTSNGWTFVVFSDGTNAELYITSSSGAPSFSLVQSLGAATEGNEIALACNGNEIYYARGSGSATYARWGNVASNGAITWATAEQTVNSYDSTSGVGITPDTAGNVWVYGGQNYYFAYENTSGTWHSRYYSNAPYFVYVAELSSGYMAFIYQTASPGALEVETWNGSAFSSAYATSNTDWMMYSGGSVTSIGNTLYLVGYTQSGSIYFLNYTYGSGAWGARTLITTAGYAGNGGQISADASSNLVISYFASSTSINYTVSTNFGTSWTASNDLITGESFEPYEEAFLSSQNIVSSYCSLVWADGADSPYTVRFASFNPTLDNTPPTYSSITTSTATAGQSCNFGVTWSDNFALSKYIFGSNVTGSWVNSTATAFSSNPQTISKTATLSSGIGDSDQFEFWANDTNNNWANTGIQTVTTLTATNILLNGVLSTVAYVNESMSVRFQQKTFYAAGNYWLFYMNGTVSNPAYSLPYFTSSSDGKTWLNPTLLNISTIWSPAMEEYTGENLEVIYANNLVNVFVRNGYYMAGTPNANGTITWLTTWQQIPTFPNTGLWDESNFDFYVSVDSSGHLWYTSVANTLYYLNGNPTYLTGQTDFVYKDEYTNGTWLTDPTVPQYIATNGTMTCDFTVALPNNQMYFFFFQAPANGAAVIYGSLWNGAQFGNIQTVTTDCPFCDTMAYGIANVNETYARTVVSDSLGNIYLAFLNTAQNLVFYEYNHNSGTWGNEQTIQSGCTNYASPALTIYQNTVSIMWINDPYTIYEKTFVNGAWSNTPIHLVTLASTSPIPTFNDPMGSGSGWNGRLNGFSQLLGTDLGVVFVTNNTANNNGFAIQFGLLNPAFYTLTASSDANSIISPSGTMIVNAGSNQSITFSPINGSYTIQSVIINGTYQAPLTSPYTFTNIQGDVSIAVSTSSIIYSVNATSDSGCVITPTGNLIYAYGTWANFTCLAYPTYQIYNLAVNGSNLGPLSSYNFMPTGNTTLSLTSITIPVTGGSNTQTTVIEPNNYTAPTPTPIAPLSKSAQIGVIVIVGILVIAIMIGVAVTGPKKTLADIFNERSRRGD